MKYYMPIIILCCFLCIITACHKKNENFISETIDIEDRSTRIGLNDVFSQIEIIPLQTTKESVVGSYMEFRVFNGAYYFRDRQQNCVFVFDKNGKLSFSSKRLQGRGPKDYYNCGHYTIDRETGNVLILDMPLREIIEYDLNGNFVRRYSFPNEFIGIMAFEKVSQYVYAFYINENVAIKNKSVIIFDIKEQKIIRRIGAYPGKYLHISTNNMPFYSINDTIVFNYMFPSYITYYIDPHGYRLQERRRFDFGEKSFTPNILPSNIDKRNHNTLMADYYNKYAIIFNRLENNRFVLVSFFCQNSYIAFLDKNSQTVLIKENKRGGNEQLLPPDAVDNQYFYSVCPASNIKQFISDSLINDNTRKILQDMKVTDNSVIVKYKFKKDGE